MVLDEEYFVGALLPQAIENGVRKFFPEAADRDVEVTVRDGRRRLVLGSEPSGQANEEVSRGFPFVYSDWTIELRRRGDSPGQWARASFASNMALSVLLALLLTGGVALALRAASRAMRLSEMKSDFVSNVSHELRTPLASIRMFAELLSLGRAPSLDKAKEYGEYIDAESRRLSRLIDNILDFARIESGRKTYQLARGDLTEVVAAVVRTFEVRLRQAGFTLTFTPPANALPLLDLDPDAIGQALHNLLDNAVKYSGDSRAIEVSVAQDQEEAVVAVRDHGIGIPRSEQLKIFERFHRVSTGLVHDVKGSGLGLAIVRHIVEAHRGRLQLVSSPGEGSTFTMRLPLRPAADAATAPIGDLQQDSGPRS
jgi:signal transduction histidine kinase